MCERRRLDTEASRFIVRRIRFGAKEGAEVEAAGMRAHFWKAIKNHKTGDYGTERLARCLPALGSLSPTQGLPFRYPMLWVSNATIIDANGS